MYVERGFFSPVGRKGLVLSMSTQASNRFVCEGYEA